MLKHVERELTKQVTGPANQPTVLTAGELTDEQLEKASGGVAGVPVVPFVWGTTRIVPVKT